MPRKFIERFQRVDRLIQRKSTGTPAQLAEKLEISQSTLYELVAVMKELGAPIYYDPYRQSYCYKEQGCFNISFAKKIATPVLPEYGMRDLPTES